MGANINVVLFQSGFFCERQLEDVTSDCLHLLCCVSVGAGQLLPLLPVPCAAHRDRCTGRMYLQLTPRLSALSDCYHN